MSTKFDPDLRAILRAAARDRATGLHLPREDREVSDEVELIVEFHGNVDDLTAVGFKRHTLIQHPTEHYQIATGAMRKDDLPRLKAIDHVVEVQGPRRVFGELKYSLPEIRATAVHSGTPPRKGDGVVIGIIDSWFDWRHGSFLKDDGKSSRIAALWDMVQKPKAGDKDGPNKMGVVYEQEQLTAELKEKTGAILAGIGLGSHGTHVAGIAAGNGRPGTCCFEGSTYVGVAPNAQLILVRRPDSTEAVIIDAIRFISDWETTKKHPKVINLSQGNCLGPHDGTSLLERAIDAFVAIGDKERCPLIVVKSAGNEGGHRRHASGKVYGKRSIDIQFHLKNAFEHLFLDLWYAREARLTVKVTEPLGEKSVTLEHGVDCRDFEPTDPEATYKSRVDIDATIDGPFNRYNNVRIRIEALESPLDVSYAGAIFPVGTWHLSLINPDDIEVMFHCWIEGPVSGFCTFIKSDTDPQDGMLILSDDSTITTPGTSVQAITVANHRSRTRAFQCSPPTGIHPESSRGPVAKGADTNRKPDIAAPGAIMSAKPDAPNYLGSVCWCCPNTCCDLYERVSGTSFSAPHVTGAIALMLEENPTLTRDQILWHLQKGARDRPTGGWDNVFGAGKLDVEGAITSLRQGRSDVRSGDGTSPHKGRNTGITETMGQVSADFPLAHQWQVAQVPQPLPPSIKILRAKFEALPDGLHIMAAISRHFSEVRRLINTNRRIATMWHRANGPHLLRLLLHDAEDADLSVPIHGSSGTHYLNRCLDLLARYGSPRLQENLRQYRTSLLMLLEMSRSTNGDTTIGKHAHE